jgi:hypothetical protein
MPIPVAVPIAMGLASVFSNLFGAKKKADAAKEAVNYQRQATDKAVALNRDVYQQQLAQQQPYMQAGQQGLTNLQQIVGNQQNRFGGGMVPGQGGPAPMNLATAFGPPPQGPTPQQGPQGPPMGGPPQGQMGGGMPPQAAQGSPQGAPQGQGQMVRLQAPTGEVIPLPANHPKIQQLIAAGARMVG